MKAKNLINSHPTSSVQTKHPTVLSDFAGCAQVFGDLSSLLALHRSLASTRPLFIWPRQRAKTRAKWLSVLLLSKNFSFQLKANGKSPHYAAPSWSLSATRRPPLLFIPHLLKQGSKQWLIRNSPL